VVGTLHWHIIHLYTPRGPVFRVPCVHRSDQNVENLWRNLSIFNVRQNCASSGSQYSSFSRAKVILLRPFTPIVFSDHWEQARLCSNYLC
jgi:hypothetical protein